MKALVGAFNQEKALVGAFSVIVQPVVEPMDNFTALRHNITTSHSLVIPLELGWRLDSGSLLRCQMMTIDLTLTTLQTRA